MAEREQRVAFIDFLKGVCIFLVVWGHSIQYLSSSGYDFWNNRIFIFIYSFHMPLFMMLSGLFFIRSMSLPFGVVLKKRFFQLILPSIVWGGGVTIFIYLLAKFLNHTLIDKEFIYQMILQSPFSYWFLFALFLCTVLAYISYSVFKNKIFVSAFVTIFIILILPDFCFEFVATKYMLPYFWLGIILSAKKLFFNDYGKSIFIFSVVLFIILLFFWKEEYYIYKTGMEFYHFDLKSGTFQSMDWKHRLWVVSFRYLIGTAGCFSMYYVVKYVHNRFSLKYLKKKMNSIGIATLGIYLISIKLNLLLEKLGEYRPSSEFIYNFVYTPVISIFILWLCLKMIAVLKKNRISKLLFLGIKTN
ncbi:acyltransferase family protein [Coprobacter sp.]